MAIIATIAIATRIMVIPASCRRTGRRWRDRGMNGLFISQFSFMATAVAVSVGGSAGADPIRLATRPNLHWYGYLILTHVLITAVCPPRACEVQVAFAG